MKMILTITDLESYVLIGIYLLFLGYVYFLTETCAQKYLRHREAGTKNQLRSSDFNIILTNCASPSRKVFDEGKNYQFKPCKPFHLKNPFPSIR